MFDKIQLRTNIVEVFEQTINQCFNTAIENMMGHAVKEQILQLIERYGIPRRDLAARFDDVVRVLTDAFGNSSRLLVYRTIVELHDEYSIRVTFGFNDSLRDQLILLRERVLADLLRPRHSRGVDDSLYMAKPLSLDH